MTRLATTYITTIALISLLASSANGGLFSTSEIDREFNFGEEDWMHDESKRVYEFGDEHEWIQMSADPALTPTSHVLGEFHDWNTNASFSRTVETTTPWAMSGQLIAPHSSVGRSELVVDAINSESVNFPSTNIPNDDLELAWKDIVPSVDATVLEDSFGEALSSFNFGQESVATYGFEVDTTLAAMNLDITAQAVGLFNIQFEGDDLQAELSTGAGSVSEDGLVIQCPATLELGLDTQPALRTAIGPTVPRDSHAPEPKPHPLLINDEAITTASGRELVSRLLRDSLGEVDGEVPSQASNNV